MMKYVWKLMSTPLHDISIDPRNAKILISLNGKLFPRDKAVVSVFDSGFILGDGVWEGLRLHEGGIPFLREHMERLYEGAKAIFMDVGLAPEELVGRLFDCLAANAGADEALMLDPHGFVATCNSTHFFIVRGGEVWTSTGQYCIPGITRGNLIRLCKKNGIPVFERDFSLYDVYGAEEAFVTGTFAGVVPISEIDGRIVGRPLERAKEWVGAGALTRQLRALYQDICKREARRSL